MIDADGAFVATPFRRGRFERLPELPLRAHDFASWRRRELTIALSEGDTRVVIYDVGDPSAPPLLLVHGLMTSAYSFRYVARALADEGFHVLVPDLPGAGQSEAPRRCDAPTLTRSILAMLDALALPRALVVGNSMGGYLTMRAALEAPERFVAIVDVHGPAFPLLRLRALDAAMAIPGARAALAHLIARDPERWVHRNVHYFDESTKSLEEARIYGEPLKTSVGRAAFVSWLVDGLDPRELEAFAAKLRALGGVFPVPLALLYARTDPMVPPEVGLRLAELFPHAEHAWLEGSSHFAHVDTPRAFVAALRPFLRAHAG